MARARTSPVTVPSGSVRIDMAKSPEFTSRHNKTGKGKKFRKLFRPNGRNQRFACALVALFGHLLGFPN